MVGPIIHICCKEMYSLLLKTLSEFFQKDNVHNIFSNQAIFCNSSTGFEVEESESFLCFDSRDTHLHSLLDNSG